jgi:chromate transporter
MIALLLTIFLVFAQCSVLAFGGGIAVLPEMQRLVVDVHHWMTAQEFTAAFALAQAAPGPNMMVVTLIGWQVAGWPGAIIASVGMFAPSAVITGATLKLWERFRDRPWRRIVQVGLVPITAGLVTSSAILITRVADTSVLLAAITAASLAASLATRWHPLVILACGALAGLAGVWVG